MRDLYEYSKIRELMEEYKPKSLDTGKGQRASVRYKPMKERVSIPKSPSQKELTQQVSTDLFRQSTSKTLTVCLSSLEIHRNEIPKKVKMLDVKLSFSYQEDFATQTVRLDKQLVRHGNKWVWVNEDGSKKVITFNYLPGDRVNLNVGIFIHKTKKHGIFGKDTITTQVGTVAECIVLARDNGVGMGIQLGTTISQNFRLNFDLNGRGHKLTMKIKLDLMSEAKGPPMIWLRPKSSSRRFRSPKTAFELLQDLPPKDKDEDARVKLYVYNVQRIEQRVRERLSEILDQSPSNQLVNYQKTAVLECRSIRPVVCDTEIPTGIEIRQVIGGQLLAFLVPVVKTIDKESYRYRLGILVVTAEGPYCLCSAKWKSSDKFDYKIFMYKTGETFGQRIKWATKDFLDISYTILNSTGHQLILRTDSESVIEDLCIGYCLKLLVRWSSEPLPWKVSERAPMIDCQKFLFTKYANCDKTISDFAGQDIKSHMAGLQQFLEAQNLMMHSDIEEFIFEDNLEEKNHRPLEHKTSHNSYDELDSKHRGELNIEDQDDDEDDAETTTVSSKFRCDTDWEDLTTSGFIDERSEYTGGGSWIDSVM